jgi:hypothetical protein
MIAGWRTVALNAGKGWLILLLIIYFLQVAVYLLFIELQFVREFVYYFPIHKVPAHY